MSLINENWIVLEREKLIKELSLAVSPLDDYTNMRPLGGVNISIKNRNYRSVRNPRGHYLFLGLPPDDYTVQVRSDFYLDENIEGITVSPRDPQEPIGEFIERAQKDMILKPKPSYPFPPGATLIRGTIRDSSGNRVPNANVKIRGTNIETETSEKGEFVLYFRPLKENEIIKDNGKRYVKVNRSKTINLVATKGVGSDEKDLEAVEGSTTIIYFELS